MTDPQHVLQAVTAVDGNVQLQKVGTVTAASWTGPSDKSEQAIWADVFDEATGTLRFVEVSG